MYKESKHSLLHTHHLSQRLLCCPSPAVRCSSCVQVLVKKNQQLISETGWISQVPNDARESFDRHDARESFDRAQSFCQTPRRSLVALCLHSPLSHIRQTIWTCGGWSLSRHNKCMASLWMYLLRHHRHSSATISKDLIIFIQLLHLDTSAI